MKFRRRTRQQATHFFKGVKIKYLEKNTSQIFCHFEFGERQTAAQVDGIEIRFVWTTLYLFEKIFINLNT